MQIPEDVGLTKMFLTFCREFPVPPFTSCSLLLPGNEQDEQGQTYWETLLGISEPSGPSDKQGHS